MNKVVRTITVVLIISLLSLCTSIAFAEEFTLHSGVTFGMTHDEVSNAEKSAGFESGEYEDMIIREDYYMEVSGMIAGVPDASIRYYFGRDDSLHEAVYTLFSAGTSADRYETLFEALSGKYGSPNADERWIEALSESAYSDRINIILINNMFGSQILDIKESVWLLEQEDGSFVSIDLLQVSKTTSNGDLQDLSYIIYSSFSGEEVNKIIGDVDSTNQEIQNQLQNDL